MTVTISLTFLYLTQPEIRFWTTTVLTRTLSNKCCQRCCQSALARCDINTTYHYWLAVLRRALASLAEGTTATSVHYFPYSPSSSCDSGLIVHMSCGVFQFCLKTHLFASLFLHSFQSLHGLIPWNIDIRCLEVFGVWGTGECGRLSQPNWVLVALAYIYFVI